jgi:hypothetical protein
VRAGLFFLPSDLPPFLSKELATLVGWTDPEAGHISSRPSPCLTFHFRDHKVCATLQNTLSPYSAKSGRGAARMAIAPPLNVGWGYGIVLGLGAVFAFGMVSLFCPEAQKS